MVMNNHLSEMLETHPNPAALDRGALLACIQACFECEQTCTSCADACLAESMVAELRHCIRVNLDCADVCATTGRVLARQTAPAYDLLLSQLAACAAACQSCADECQRHAAMHAHCRVCADACRRCAAACNQLLQMAPAA
jgi:hypothetical protein